jgi:hypothetical protein
VRYTEDTERTDFTDVVEDFSVFVRFIRVVRVLNLLFNWLASISFSQPGPIERDDVNSYLCASFYYTLIAGQAKRTPVSSSDTAQSLAATAAS